MIIKKQSDAFVAIGKLIDKGFSLSDAVEDDYDFDSDDWTALLRILEKLIGFRNMIGMEFTVADLVMHFNSDGFNNDEEKFEIQKTINKFYEMWIIAEANSLIKILSTWGFRDYRCIDYQREAKAVVESILALYSEIQSMMNTYISSIPVREQQ